MGCRCSVKTWFRSQIDSVTNINNKKCNNFSNLIHIVDEVFPLSKFMLVLEKPRKF